MRRGRRRAQRHAAAESSPSALIATRCYATRRAGGNVHTSHRSVSHRTARIEGGRRAPHERRPGHTKYLLSTSPPSLPGAARDTRSVLRPTPMQSSALDASSLQEGRDLFGGRRGGAARGVANAARSRRPSRGPEAGGLPRRRCARVGRRRRRLAVQRRGATSTVARN